MPGVVPATVTEIDPPDERDLLVVPAGAKENELLVVGSRATDARVQEHLASCLVDGACKIALFRLVEPQRLWV
jgi:hypothetical protein